MSEVRKYADRTTVSVPRSQAEVERLVAKIGASSVVCGRDGFVYVFAFKVGDRAYRYSVNGVNGDDAETRRRWRVLVLQVRARVSLVLEAGESIEEAFMPHQVLPDGRTVVDAIGAQLAAGRAPRLLPEGST